MAKRTPPANNEELLRALGDLFDQVDAETPEEVDAMLREEGYDPSDLAATFRSIAEQALKASPYNWKNRALREMQMERDRLSAKKPSSPLSRPELIVAIQKQISKASLGPSLSAGIYHRNLEELTDEDLKSLLEELQFLTPSENDETQTPEE